MKGNEDGKEGDRAGSTMRSRDAAKGDFPTDGRTDRKP